MEQTATSSSSLLASASATEDEIIVSQILLDLKTLMSLSESLSNWGRRRRRSCLEASPPPPPLNIGSSLPSASPENRIEERRTPIKAEEDEKHGDAARTTASPDTPLSFSPSESDDKPRHSSKKISKKRSREDYLDMIDVLTQRKELLSGEIENVNKYYNKLKAYNSQLKAMEQEVTQALRREEPEMELAQHYRMHWEPADSTAQCASAHLQPSNYGLGSINSGGPLGIDLNLPAEEAYDGVELYRPLDAVADKRARSAEARRRRIGLIKTKSSRNVL